MKSISRVTFRQGLAVVLLSVAAATASAQQFKIGFVNTDRIFRDSAAAKAAQTKLEQEFSRREREIETLRTQLQTAS